MNKIKNSLQEFAKDAIRRLQYHYQNEGPDMNMNATTAATERARVGRTVRTSIRSVAAAVALAAGALAAGALLFAAPEADARPPRGVEDAIQTAKADCTKKISGKWEKNGVFGYLCTYRTGAYYILQHIDKRGSYGQVCYRLDVEAPWTCN